MATKQENSYIVHTAWFITEFYNYENMLVLHV